MNVNVGSAKGTSLKTICNDQVNVQASNDAYYMPVSFIADNTVVESNTVVNRYGSGASCSAPKTITNPNNPGAKYQINGSNYKQVSFGTPSVDFTYSRVVRNPYTSNVSYVDQDGNGIGKDSFTVTEANGGSFTPQSVITAANGRSYKLMNGQGAVSQSYDDGARNYTFRYQLQENAAARPYFITVRYVSDGTLLNANTYTVTNGKTVKVTTPATYTTPDGIEYKRKSGEEASISHSFDQGMKTYTIEYEKNVTDSNQPYSIRINYVDLLSGRTISSKSADVAVNKTVSINIDSSIKAVSYTHLDVYKRQVEDKALDKVLGNDEIGGKKFSYSGVQVSVKVSNNLNVYKEVKGQYDETYLSTANIASTAPNGSISYLSLIHI